MEKINSRLEEQKLQQESSVGMVNNIMQQVNGSDISGKISIDTDLSSKPETIPTDFYQVINNTESKTIQFLRGGSLRESYATSSSATTSQKSEIIDGDIDNDALSFIDKIKRQKNKIKNAIAEMFGSATSIIDSLFNSSGRSESMKSDKTTGNNG